MDTFYIKIGGLSVEMHSRYPFAKKYCEDYITDKCSADIIASVSDEEIQADVDTVEGCTAQSAEPITLYRSIAEQLPAFDRMICHGATIEYNGKAYFFTAPSGTGKTTHISLWKRFIGEPVHIINGDKPLFHVSADLTTVYGTPWCGKEGWQRNDCAPLGAICFIKRDSVNSIKRVDPAELIDSILKQIYLPKSAEALMRTIDLTDKMLRSVPVFVLTCDMTENAVRTSFEALTGENFEEKRRK